MRVVFTKKLEKLAEKNPDIFLLTADLGKFLNSFKEKFPERFINCGVAEQNMIGIAAGLSLLGKNVYCYSVIPFLTMKALENIRVDICYQNLNIKLLGAGGGLVYGFEGMTHQAIEDISIMRSLPNMTVVAPGDLLEAEAIAEESVNFPGPLYIRFGKDKPSQVHQTPPNFKIGKGIVLKEGKKIALIVAGTLLSEAKKTVESLAGKGVNITLISMPTIKPIDRNLLEELAKNHQAIFTFEDHSEIGGLGTAITEVLVEMNFKGKIKKIALPDEYSKYVGEMDYLYKCYGLDSEYLIKYILKEYQSL